MFRQKLQKDFYHLPSSNMFRDAMYISCAHLVVSPVYRSYHIVVVKYYLTSSNRFFTNVLQCFRKKKKVESIFEYIFFPCPAQTCLLTQYVSRGDMLRILRRCRSRRRDQEPFAPLPQEELLNFACDIAAGMRHLSSLKVRLENIL